MEAGGFEVLKNSRSGQVLAGEMNIGAAAISIVIKRTAQTLVALHQRNRPRFTGAVRVA